MAGRCLAAGCYLFSPVRLQRLVGGAVKEFAREKLLDLDNLQAEID